MFEQFFCGMVVGKSANRQPTRNYLINSLLKIVDFCDKNVVISGFTVFTRAKIEWLAEVGRSIFLPTVYDNFCQPGKSARKNHVKH